MLIAYQVNPIKSKLVILLTTLKHLSILIKATTFSLLHGFLMGHIKVML